jgi:hypothetical protein
LYSLLHYFYITTYFFKYCYNKVGRLMIDPPVTGQKKMIIMGHSV